MRRCRDTSTIASRVKLPGAHRLVRRLVGGWVIYWQAWRGGPRIGKFEGVTLAAAELQESASADKIAEAYAAARRTDVPADTLAGLVSQYRASPEWQGVAEATRKQWVRWLDRIVEDHGEFPVVALKAKGARKIFITWRNGFAAHPRQADYAIQVLRRVISWSMENELAEANPAMGIKELYSSDRSAEIVEAHELAAILPIVSPGMSRAFRLAAETGLRRSDLVRLKKADINATSIELATGKSRGRKRIIVPLLPAARDVLAECEAAETTADPTLRSRATNGGRGGKARPDAASTASLFVLTGEHGTQYKANSLTHAWVKAAATAGVDKTLHDLRGTFATRLMAKGLSDEEIADIMGWDTEDVRKIRRRYVDRDKIATLIAARIGRQRRAPKGQA